MDKAQLLTDEFADSLANFIMPILRARREELKRIGNKGNDSLYHEVIGQFVKLASTLSGVRIENSHELRSALSRALHRRRSRKK